MRDVDGCNRDLFGLVVTEFELVNPVLSDQSFVLFIKLLPSQNKAPARLPEEQGVEEGRDGLAEFELGPGHGLEL